MKELPRSNASLQWSVEKCAVKIDVFWSFKTDPHGTMKVLADVLGRKCVDRLLLLLLFWLPYQQYLYLELEIYRLMGNPLSL